MSDLQDADLEQSLKKEKKSYILCSFVHFLCSSIPNLALGILKMLIPLCFCDVLQLVV